jgi:hypothetical protein
MPYDFSIEEEEDHIRVSVSGDRIRGREVKDIIPVWSSVADICRERKINRVLAVFQLTGSLPTMRSYDIVTKAKEFGWSRHFHLAIVDHNVVSRQNNLFTETVAVNRGYQVSIFDNEQHAKEWLLGEKGTIRN